MANLRRIEEMRWYLYEEGRPTAPRWVRGYHQDEKIHLSGRLREASYAKGISRELEALLDEAAEALDDAHEAWLEDQVPRRVVP